MRASDRWLRLDTGLNWSQQLLHPDLAPLLLERTTNGALQRDGVVADGRLTVTLDPPAVRVRIVDEARAPMPDLSVTWESSSDDEDWRGWRWEASSFTSADGRAGFQPDADATGEHRGVIEIDDDAIRGLRPTRAGPTGGDIRWGPRPQRAVRGQCRLTPTPTDAPHARLSDGSIRTSPGSSHNAHRTRCARTRSATEANRDTHPRTVDRATPTAAATRR